METRRNSVFNMSGNRRRPLVVDGFPFPSEAIEVNCNSEMPTYFDKIGLFIDLKKRMYVRFQKNNKVFWVELDGESKDLGSRFVKVTLEEDYEISDLVLEIQVTYTSGTTLSHGPTAKLTMSDLDVEV